jgi:integrase
MNTLNIEQGVSPAHSIALSELVALYLEYHTKLDKSDKYATKQGFGILADLFPPEEIPNIATFKVGFLVKYQKKLIEMNYAKSQINKLFNVVKRVFAWAGKPRYDLETWDKLPPMIPSEFITDMNAIDPVDEGKETPPRTDVPTENVEAIFPHVSPIIKDMLRIQLLTGMRPSEICKMRVGDIKTTREQFAEYSRLYDGENWIYVLPGHKTYKKIGKRAIPIGLEEQGILLKYIDFQKPEMPVFKNSKGTAYSRAEYGRKIKKAIEKNNLEKFVPYQLRHTNITDVSEKHGRDIARAVAGHTTEAMTAIYDHSDFKKALDVVIERNNIYRTKNNERPTLRVFTGN